MKLFSKSFRRVAAKATYSLVAFEKAPQNFFSRYAQNIRQALKKRFYFSFCVTLKPSLLSALRKPPPLGEVVPQVPERAFEKAPQNFFVRFAQNIGSLLPGAPRATIGVLVHKRTVGDVGPYN